MVCAKLTEPGIKAWIRGALRIQREKDDKTTNAWFNLLMLAGLVLVVGSVLSYRYDIYRDPVVQKRNEDSRKQYIMDKLQRLASIQSGRGMITSLPDFESFTRV